MWLHVDGRGREWKSIFPCGNASGFRQCAFLRPTEMSSISLEGVIYPPSVNWYRFNVVDVNAAGVMAFGAKNQVLLFNIRTQRFTNILRGHKDIVTSVSFLSTAKGSTDMLVTGSNDKKVILWDATTGEQLKSHIQHSKVHNSSPIRTNLAERSPVCCDMPSYCIDCGLL